MDILKREDGVSIMESLVSIVLLGTVVLLSIMVMKGLFSHPKPLLKGEACQLASTEIDFCLRYSVVSDTLYNNIAGNLQVKRTISQVPPLTKISVMVTYKGTGEAIAGLEVYDYR